MIEQKKVFEYMQKTGVGFITGVPDSTLNEFCLYAASELPHDQHVIAANEGNAVALAAGYHLATGGVPLVYMQNSGFGNAMNPLLSLVDKDVYAIPMVLLIGWRGEPGTGDWVQHNKQGQLTPVLLEVMEIPFRTVAKDIEGALDSMRWAITTAKKTSGPVALLVPKGVFEKGKSKQDNPAESPYSMSREEAIKCIIETLPADTIFVATTGRATREIFHLRRASGAGHEKDFLNVGAMGHASQIATGIALAKKDRLVVCLDGDGSAIMHLGALTITGVLSPPNFLHVVLNNGAHESVGGQPTVGFNVNLTTIAEGSGYKTVGLAVETEQNMRAAVRQLFEGSGPAFIDVRIRKGLRKDLPPLNVSSHRDLKNLFMKELQQPCQKK